MMFTADGPDTVRGARNRSSTTHAARSTPLSVTGSSPTRSPTTLSMRNTPSGTHSIDPSG